MNSDGARLFRRMWFIGFAGHRRTPDPARLKTVILRELEGFAADLDGEIIGLSSAAAGADLLFLESCAELGIRTVVILPFGRERFAEDFEVPEEWERAVRLMDSALWCEVAKGGEKAPEAYHVVSREILEISDRMLLAWDGLPPRGLGGTGETVAEALKLKVPARIIDPTTFQSSWQTGSPPAPAKSSSFDDLPPAKSIRGLFRKLDQRALRGAPRSRWFTAGSMSVNHVATFIQAALIIFLTTGAKEVGAALKFVLAMIAAGLPWVGARLRLQDSWVKDRVRAEILRSLLSSHDPASPLHPPALDLFEQEGPFIRSAALQLVGRRLGWERSRDRYLTGRIDDQIRFFEKQGHRAEGKMKWFGKLFWFASWGALVFTGGAVFMKLYAAMTGNPIHRSWEKWAIEFIPVLLPGIAAWSLAMISVFEYRRRAGLYGQIVKTLRGLRPKLEEAKCASVSEHTIRQIERLLLNELWEWQGSRKK
jgi:hypothetical protein